GRSDARLRPVQDQDARCQRPTALGQGRQAPPDPARVGGRVRPATGAAGGRLMTAKCTRANGEGSIFPYRNGFAAYVWVTKPDGKRTRKYVYGHTREIVHDKWLALHRTAKEGPVATRTPSVGDYVRYWLREIVQPNLSPGTYVTYE